MTNAGEQRVAVVTGGGRGIGAAIAQRLAWLGIDLDANANLQGGPRISREGSRVPCYVIPTDEELMIARHALQVLRSHDATSPKEKSA